ncbi:peptidase C60 [Kocuria flava]|uniref:Peptidase C60 n=1 Tax=Kocuria flava TaxID=446860 RepID=A0A0U3GKJ6_9MICC|nr:class F sortase [Kocuria flava]ALU40734.1 peptidase C60 [Kocuria flava]GEO93647.1 hypothetical protein KFL01_29530 [Kocuria flava]
MDAPAPSGPTRRRWAAPAAGLAVLAVGAGVLAGQPWADGDAAPAPQVSATRDPEAAGTPGPAPGGQDPDAPAAAPPVRLAVPDAGLDVPVDPLTPTEQDLASRSLVPPKTPDGYWLTPYGAPGQGSKNTTYIAGHSFDGRDAPFNALSDPSLVGSEVEVQTETGTVAFEIDSVVTHDKNTLKDSDIWQIVPGRLVIISCYTEDIWGKNVVLTASPAD